MHTGHGAALQQTQSSARTAAPLRLAAAGPRSVAVQAPTAKAATAASRSSSRASSRRALGRSVTSPEVDRPPGPGREPPAVAMASVSWSRVSRWASKPPRTAPSIAIELRRAPAPRPPPHSRRSWRVRRRVGAPTPWLGHGVSRRAATSLLAARLAKRGASSGDACRQSARRDWAAAWCSALARRGGHRVVGRGRGAVSLRNSSVGGGAPGAACAGRKGFLTGAPALAASRRCCSATARCHRVGSDEGLSLVPRDEGRDGGRAPEGLRKSPWPSRIQPAVAGPVSHCSGEQEDRRSGVPGRCTGSAFHRPARLTAIIQLACAVCRPLACSLPTGPAVVRCTGASDADAAEALFVAHRRRCSA